MFNKNRTKFIHCPISLTGSYTIPASVDSIGIHAFAYCKGLTSVTIPSSVTTIEFFSFLKCSGLISVYIPSSVTTIQQEAFDGCSGLINVDTNNANYSSKDGILFDKTQATLIQCPTSKTGIYTIPSSVKSIGRYAFSGCIGLTSVTIPSSVTTIELSAFQACVGLTNITIPSTVTTIEYGTFYNCTGLFSVILPSTINSIQDWTLGGCIGLRSIYIYTMSPPSLDNFLDVFTRVNKTSSTLFVPYGSKADYQVAAQWKDFTNIVEMSGFRPSAKTLSIKAEQGSKVAIDISSDVTFTVNSDQTWLKVSLEKSNEISTLNFIADENASDTLRIATITVSATGVESQTITVTQEAKYITGIDQLSIKPEVMIYPNPTTGKVLLVFDKVPVDGISLTVNDLNGKICLKQLIRDKEGWIDLSGNVPGIYFIKTDQENIKAQKVILK